MKQMLLIDARTLDPDHNLALEEYVFTSMPRDKEYLILWQNDNAVIIGRHQNTLAEIDESYVQEKGIRVVRRMSGGGAVYHDLGNLNFSFIVDAAGSQVDLERFCLRIAVALGKLGLDARLDGRNDILAEGCKISGNAQYMKEGRVMHHGTLLFDSDLSVLSKALKPDPEKIKAKGVKSVRSRVANIRSLLKQDMTLQEFRDHLARYLLGGDGVRYQLTEQDLAAVEAIRAARYGTWEWNYGASPSLNVSILPIRPRSWKENTITIRSSHFVSFHSIYCCPNPCTLRAEFLPFCSSRHTPIVSPINRSRIVNVLKFSSVINYAIVTIFVFYTVFCHSCDSTIAPLIGHPMIQFFGRGLTPSKMSTKFFGACSSHIHCCPFYTKP